MTDSEGMVRFYRFTKGNTLLFILRPNTPYESQGGIMKEECISILKRFYEKGNERRNTFFNYKFPLRKDIGKMYK